MYRGFESPPLRQIHTVQSDGALLFVAVYPDKAIFRAELDAGRVACLSTFQHLPTIEKLDSNIQEPKRVPDQIRRCVLAFVICRLGLKFGVLHLGIPLNQVGAHTLLPVVLVGCVSPAAGVAFKSGFAAEITATSIPKPFDRKLRCASYLTFLG